jgi:hypothetical protein
MSASRASPSTRARRAVMRPLSRPLPTRRNENRQPRAACAAARPGIETIYRGETRSLRHAESSPSELRGARDPPFCSALATLWRRQDRVHNRRFCGAARFRASLIVMRPALRTKRSASKVQLYGQTADHFSG